MAGSISASTALLISAGVGLATTGVSLGLQASQDGPKPPSQVTSSQQQAEAADAASKAQAEALMKRRGMSATTLTSPLGTSGTASVGKATLG